MDVSPMMAGSGVTRKAKDMVTDDMLSALQKHYKSEIKSIGVSETAGTRPAAPHASTRSTPCGLNKS